MELLTGMNYCDLKISEEFLKKTNQYTALLELYKCNGMHREALKLLLQLVEESKSDHAAELTKKFTPEMIIDYLKVTLLFKTEVPLIHILLGKSKCTEFINDIYLYKL